MDSDFFELVWKLRVHKNFKEKKKENIQSWNEEQKSDCRPASGDMDKSRRSHYWYDRTKCTLTKLQKKLTVL